VLEGAELRRIDGLQRLPPGGIEDLVVDAAASRLPSGLKASPRIISAGFISPTLSSVSRRGG
jgi:hypothetical protein